MESSITQYLYKKEPEAKKIPRFPIFFCPAKSKGLRFRDCRDGGFKEEKARSYRKSANGNNLAYILQFSSCPYTRKT